MSKPASTSVRLGVLEIPFEPFYGSPVAIGTECVITGEDEDRYVVKFPGVCSVCKSADPEQVSCNHAVVGYAGTHRIKRTYVREI